VRVFSSKVLVKKGLKFKPVLSFLKKGFLFRNFFLKRFSRFKKKEGVCVF